MVVKIVCFLHRTCTGTRWMLFGPKLQTNLWWFLARESHFATILY